MNIIKKLLKKAIKLKKIQIFLKKLQQRRLEITKQIKLK